MKEGVENLDKQEPTYLILDPKSTVIQRDINIFRNERDYFESLIFNDVT